MLCFLTATAASAIFTFIQRRSSSIARRRRGRLCRLTVFPIHIPLVLAIYVTEVVEQRHELTCNIVTKEAFRTFQVIRFLCVGNLQSIEPKISIYSPKTMHHRLRCCCCCTSVHNDEENFGIHPRCPRGMLFMVMALPHELSCVHTDT